MNDHDSYLILFWGFQLTKQNTSAFNKKPIVVTACTMGTTKLEDIICWIKLFIELKICRIRNEIGYVGLFNCWRDFNLMALIKFECST